MNDIELGAMGAVSNLLVDKNGGDLTMDIVEEKVSTATFGEVSVSVCGDRSKPAICTFHDLGLNGNSCFQSFFQFSDMAEVSHRFCVYHINAPGQEEDANTIPEGNVYPTLDDMAESVVTAVVDHFKIRSFVGLGVGVGANILCRYAVMNPKKMDGLILINCLGATCGWIEWGYQKMNMSYLRGRGMTTFTLDYLMWHHFGRNMDRYHPDMVASYKQYFARLRPAPNLAAFIQSITSRTPLPVVKDNATGSNIKCPVLQVVGSGSPFVEDTVDLNSRLNPADSSWMKLNECSGLVLEEQPLKVTEAVLLFFQGIGYYPTFNHLKWVKDHAEPADLTIQQQQLQQDSPMKHPHIVPTSEPREAHT